MCYSTVGKVYIEIAAFKLLSTTQGYINGIEYVNSTYLQVSPSEKDDSFCPTKFEFENPTSSYHCRDFSIKNFEKLTVGMTLYHKSVIYCSMMK